MVDHLCRSAGRVITFPLGTDRRLRLVRAALCRKIRRDHGVDLASVAPPALVVDAANGCLRIDGRAHVQAVGSAGFDFKIGTPSGDESLIVTADEAAAFSGRLIQTVDVNGDGGVTLDEAAVMRERLGSPGLPMPGYQALLVDPETGEILARPLTYDEAVRELGLHHSDLRPDGKLARQQVATSAPVAETPEDLKLLARDPEEFAYLDLQKQIADMKSKGIDTRAYEVDLQTKLAIPLISQSP